ncbi:MAG: peptide deformylase [Burkholderiaceae bacterium]
MALLPILHYPDPRLRKVAQRVTQFDSRLRTFVGNLSQTMYDANGVGLAATQVDVHERVIVIDTSDTRDQLQVFVNPRIVQASSLRRVAEEGCLSVPGVYDEVERPDAVTVEAEDERGRTFSIDAEGLLATCIQHEMDHLSGKVFVDYLSQLKQNRIRSRMRKLDRDIA